MFLYDILIMWKCFTSFVPKRHNNKIAIKGGNSRIITTVLMLCTNRGWPRITQMLMLETNTVSESCTVHPIYIIMQIKTLSRL